MADVYSSELWLPIPGFPYAVSSHGQVKRTKKGGSNAARIGKILKPTPDKDGYAKVTLHRNGKPHYYRVSVLVCLAFHGPKPFPEAQVRHLNADVFDNTPRNLQWGSAQDNSDDCVRHGNHGYGENHPRAKFTQEQVNALRKRYGELRAARHAQGFAHVPKGTLIAWAEEHNVKVSTLIPVLRRRKYPLINGRKAMLEYIGG